MASPKLISPISKQGIQRLRVAAYCRVSSSSADQLNSYTNQINTYTRIINDKKEWELVEIFADEGLSGTKSDKRAEFQRMLQMCELGKIDLIITKSVSRFARNTKETLEYTRRLKLIGVGVQFEKEGINTLALGDEMLLNTFAAIAQEEAQSNSMNQRVSFRKRMEMGEYVASNAPYGFRLVNGQLEIYEEEAKVVRMIYDLYLNGKSTYKIARKLREMGIPSKNGCEKWASFVVSYILTNERYKGDCLYQKTYREPVVPFKQHYNRGQEDMFYAENTHKPLIDKETFDKVQVLITSRREQYGRENTSNIYPLTSRIRCTECGSNFCRKIRRKSIKWVCTKHNEDAGSCDSYYYSEERIYDGIISMMNKLRFGREDIIAQVIERLESASLTYKRNNQVAQDMSQSIADLNSKQLMLDQLQAKGYLANEVYQSQSREIRKQIGELKERRQETYESNIQKMLIDVKHLKEILDEIEEPLEEFDQRLFEEIITDMTINKHDELTITVIGGLKFTELI